nr:MAG TPA: YopX protein [Caudoviricetes sp.]
MTREILFKAKRKDNGEWVEGFLFKQQLESDVWCIGVNAISANDFSEIYGRNVDWFIIDPYTLCQYTGLTDKNGKKIWENDILTCHKHEYDLVRVVFGEFNAIDADTLETIDRAVGWHTEVIETDALSKCEPFCLPMPLTDYYIDRGEMEVVGNVFDDLEVVK